MVRRIAAGLKREGAVDEYGIGLLGENRPEWPIAYLSILAAGSTVVPLDVNLKPDEIAYIVKHSGIKSVFVSPKAADAWRATGCDMRLFSFDEEDSDSWGRLLESEPLETFDTSNELAALIYTSGTTGAPKAVELTHRNMISNVEGVKQILELHPSDRFLSILPLHHTFEATAGFLLPSLSGASVVYARSFKSRDIVEDIRDNQATLMVGVPLLYEKMAHAFHKKVSEAPVLRRAMFKTLMGLSNLGWSMGKHWGKGLFRSVRSKSGLGSIRIFCSGGAPLPPHVSKAFNLMGWSFLQGYGLTETSPVMSVNRLEDIKFGSVGPPLPNVEVKIHNPNELGIGEVICRGENNTRGYRGNPNDTAELIRDGWLYTGDLGRLAEGHLWITGRQKNVIVSASGKNIYPEELEEKLLASDLVMEVVVFGRKKTNRQGEEVRAILVPDLDMFDDIDQERPDLDLLRNRIGEVVAQVNQRVADYKRISHHEVQIEELEKTSTRKVKRFVYK